MDKFVIQPCFNIKGAFAINEETNEITMLVSTKKFTPQQIAKWVRDYHMLSLHGFNQLFLFDSKGEAKDQYKYNKAVFGYKLGKIVF